LEYAEGNLLHWQKLLCIFCSICSLQQAISGAIVATLCVTYGNSKLLHWHAAIFLIVIISDRCYAVSALRKATYSRLIWVDKLMIMNISWQNNTTVPWNYILLYYYLHYSEASLDWSTLLDLSNNVWLWPFS